jgi:hypothetical protein
MRRIRPTIQGSENLREERRLKVAKKLIFVTILVLTMLVVVTPVLAGGDKNRGDVGVGDVEQHQVSWDDYASHRLVQYQEQMLAQNQEQVKAQARWRYSKPLHMWY